MELIHHDTSLDRGIGIHQRPTGRFVLDIEHRDPSATFERASKK